MEANKVLLIFETLAPSAFIIKTSCMGGAGLGAVCRVTPNVWPTWPGRGLGRRLITYRAGPEVPSVGAVHGGSLGSPNNFPGCGRNLSEVEAVELLEVRLWRV